MAHMKKFGRGAVANMIAHDDRSQKENGNKNIDEGRTQFNYDFQNGENGLERYQRILNQENLKCMNRKDVNTMMSWVITLPDGVKDQEQFFKLCNDFLQDRYCNKGIENFIGAYVHMDEVTPHMHFNFVPVVYDEKKDRFSVCAKKVGSRSDLQSFHTDLEQYLSERGCKAQILNGATIDGNMTIKELKLREIENRHAELYQEVSRLESEKIKLKSHIHEDYIELKDLDNQIQIKRDIFHELEDLDKVAVLTYKEALQKVAELNVMTEEYIPKFLQYDFDFEQADEYFQRRGKTYVEPKKLAEEVNATKSKYAKYLSDPEVGKIQKKVSGIKKKKAPHHSSQDAR